MKPINFKKAFLSTLLAVITSLTSYGQQSLWVGQSYTFDVSSSVMGITANMSWSTSGGYLSLSGSGLYRNITVTQYFSGTATVTCEWDYKLTSSGSYTHTKRQVSISCRDNQVSISPTSLTMSPGDTRRVSYRHQYDNQYTSYANAYFQSSDPSVCTVSDAGEVVAKNPGTTYINVYSKISSVSPYCRVTVENVEPTSISIPSSLTMTVGEQKTLTASVYPSNSKTDIRWKTSNPEIATVSSNGTITALKHGTVQITATTDNGISSTCHVMINKSKLLLSSSHSSGLISKNTGVQLTASYPDASIYYTTDGTTPSTSSSKYIGPINISDNTTLKAIAVHPDYLDSDVIELKFEITSLSLLNTTPEQGVRNSAPHLFPCLTFNSSIKEDTEFDNIKVLYNDETIPFEAIINGDKLYIVPEIPLDNHLFNIVIPEKAVANYSNEYNTLIIADFDYTTSAINLVDTWTTNSRLMDNGDLYIWGYKEDFPNTSYGINSFQGTPIKALTGIKKHYPYYSTYYYITEDDILMGWGNNYNDPFEYFLGDGTKIHRDNAVKIADNVYCMETVGHTGGLIKNDGTLWLWGNNGFGQIGNGTYGTGNYVLSPVKILSNVKDFSLGGRHALALKDDGSVWAWGYNKAIGRASSGAASTPIKIIDSDVVEIKAEPNIVLKENGDVYCFGENNYGQIGNGRTSSYEAPYKVMSDVKHVYAGRYGCYALKSNGELYRWGLVAGASTTGVSTPKLVASNVNEVYVTLRNVVVLMNDNSVWCMGDNYFGLLGLGYTSLNTHTTTLSKVFEDVEKVWACDSKIFVRKLDGSYWGIGQALSIDTDGSYGQMNEPVEVLNIPIHEVISISLPDVLVVEIGCKGMALLDINPSNANYEGISWTSFDTDIATISENGVIYGNSIGETIIEAKLSDYTTTYTSNCLVKIVDIGTGLEAITSTLKDEYITIYDMNGVVVYKGVYSSIPNLNSGVYIISSKTKTIKYLKR